MAEYDNTNRGSIWKSKNKTEPQHADFNGSLNVDGVEYFVDAWKRKEGASESAPALTFRVKKKNSQGGGGGGSKPQTKPAQKPVEDDVPF